MSRNLTDAELQAAAQRLILKTDDSFKADASRLLERKTYFPAIKKAKARGSVYTAIRNSYRASTAAILLIAAMICCLFMGGYMGKISSKVNATYDAVMWYNFDDTEQYKNVKLTIVGEKVNVYRNDVRYRFEGDLTVSDATTGKIYLFIDDFTIENYEGGYTIPLRERYPNKVYNMYVDRLHKDFTLRYFTSLMGERQECMVTVNAYNRDEAVDLTRKIWRSYQYGVMDCTDEAIEKMAREKWQ